MVDLSFQLISLEDTPPFLVPDPEPDVYPTRIWWEILDYAYGLRARKKDRRVASYVGDNTSHDEDANE